MTTTPTSGAADLASRLRNACTSVRSKSYPLADLIPLMQQAADALASTPAQAGVPAGFLHNVIALCTQRGYSPENIEAWSTDDKWIADLWRQAAQMLAAAPAQPVAEPSYEHQRAIMEGERNASLDAYSRVIYLTGAESRLYEAGFTNGWQRASHGQAPAQAARADSAQEDAALWHWLAEYLVGTRTDLDDEIVASETVNDLRKIVEAAIKQGGA